MDDDITLEQQLENTFSSRVRTAGDTTGSNLVSGRYSKRSTYHDKATFLAEIPKVIKDR